MADIETDLTADRSLAASLAPGPFLRWLAVGWSVTKRHVLWTVVPLVTTAVAAFAVVRALPDPAWPVRPRTGFPGPVVDLWTFAGVPAGSVSALADAPLAVAVPVSAAFTGLVGGAYLGTLADLLAHERPSPVDSLGTYGPVLAAFAIVWRALELGLDVALDTSVVAGVAAYPVVLYVTYRVWATPFVLVSDDGGLRSALGRAWRLSGRGGAFRQFSLWLLAVTLVLSLPASRLALWYGPAGLAAATVLAAPVGLTLTAASLGFVRSCLRALPDREEAASGTDRVDDSVAGEGQTGSSVGGSDEAAGPSDTHDGGTPFESPEAGAGSESTDTDGPPDDGTPGERTADTDAGAGPAGDGTDTDSDSETTGTDDGTGRDPRTEGDTGLTEHPEDEGVEILSASGGDEPPSADDADADGDAPAGSETDADGDTGSTGNDE